MSAFSGELPGACVDQYRIIYTVQPAGEVHWISPDHVPQSVLPVVNEAKAGSTILTLGLKRYSSTHLIAEFTMTTSKHKEALLATIEMDDSQPKTYSGQILNVQSGSVWGISLSPICREI